MVCELYVNLNVKKAVLQITEEMIQRKFGNRKNKTNPYRKEPGSSSVHILGLNLGFTCRHIDTEIVWILLKADHKIKYLFILMGQI